MKCKNCRHLIIEKKDLNDSSIKYLDHKPFLLKGKECSHSLACACKKPEVLQ